MTEPYHVPPQQQPLDPPPPENDRLRFFTTPLSQRGWPKWMVAASALLGLAYLLNPTAGILEFIPDNLPLVGNLDEAGAVLLIWYGLLEMLKGRRP